ncbi:MAG TPA: hemolysin family protein [Aestuariivirgaceae bacterium]|nr:hemolysin family protein [Aestuariivirgaceae bacterium]
MNDDPSRPDARSDAERTAARPEAAESLESEPPQSPSPERASPESASPESASAGNAPDDDNQGGVTDWLKGLFGRGDETDEAGANGSGGEARFAAPPEAGSMMRNLLEFVDLRVEDVMVPRAEIVAIDEDASVHELLHRFMEANHSRLPVYRETLDDPVGMVHIKDFLRWLTERTGMPPENGKQNGKPNGKRNGNQNGKNRKADKDNASDSGQDSGQDSGKSRPGAAKTDVGDVAVTLPEADLDTTVMQTGILRPLLFVPPSMRAADLLVKMQSTRSHMAIVVDEYGGTDGLVSIEDLVEEIVGDIADEHDEDEAELISPAEDGVYLADARAPIEDVEKLLGLSLLPEEREEDADSLGGLIVSMLGRVPVRGELLRHPAGIELEILEADPRRVRKIRIHARPKPQRQRRKEPGGQG